MATLSLGKEIYELQQNISVLTDGQARVSSWDTDTVRTFIVEINPNEGYYKDEPHIFVFKLSPNYPVDPPSVTCTSDIFHPNIDIRNTAFPNVCLNILELGEWCPGIGLTGCVLGLVYLLHNPNIHDPISPLFYSLKNEKHYAKHLRNLKMGAALSKKKTCCHRVLCRLCCCCCCTSCR